MVKHCTKCRRKWIVSIMDKQEYYICPECEGEGMKLERLLIATAQSVMISAQTDFYMAYQTAVAGAMAIGCTEEKAIEIADKAVERNAEKIGIVSERKNIVETIRKKTVKEKPDFIDELLAEVEK